MFEVQLTKTYAEAHQKAHQERSDAFARVLRAMPQMVKSIRRRN